MARGGKRPNGGRPKGSKTKRTAIIKNEAIARGLDPADVLQEALEMFHKAKNWPETINVAEMLMPYRHPRKAAVEVSGSLDVNNLPDDELANRIAAVEAQLAAGAAEAP